MNSPRENTYSWETITCGGLREWKETKKKEIIFSILFSLGFEFILINNNIHDYIWWKQDKTWSVKHLKGNHVFFFSDCGLLVFETQCFHSIRCFMPHSGSDISLLLLILLLTSFVLLMFPWWLISFLWGILRRRFKCLIKWTSRGIRLVYHRKEGIMGIHTHTLKHTHTTPSPTHTYTCAWCSLYSHIYDEAQ